MTERILIDAAHMEEVRVILANDQRLEEFEFESEGKRQIKSNIYLGKITRVEPSLQAAFVEYGGNRQGFLPFAEVHFDYYQIPIADKEKLLEAVAREAESASSAKVIAAPQQVVTLESEDALEVVLDAANPEAGDVKPVRRRRGRKPRIVEGAEGVGSTPENTDAAAQQSESAVVGDPILATLPVVELDPEEVRRAEELARQFAIDEGYELPEEPRNHNVIPVDGADMQAEMPMEESYGDDGDEMAELRAHRSRFYRQYKIQEVLKRNQIVLVQVIKEERGSKGASLTTYISLPGRYCVLMPNTDRAGGVSRRITNPEERQKLKEVIAKMETPKGVSVIMRTAGVGHSQEDILKDYDYLRNLWDGIRRRTLESTAPALVYEEGNLVKRSLRDMFRDHVKEVVIEGADGYRAAREFVELMAPERVGDVHEHQSPVPIFKQYGMEAQLDELYTNTAKLPSGGSIVMNMTEALVAIDVNSGRATRERSIEDTALRTNLEAAVEIARQLRLRDMAGLVVIDFIDMRDLRNRRTVERALKDALKQDRAKIQVGRISMFGLLEMSRQRMHSSIVEATSTECSHCKGTGFVRTEKSVAISLLRVLEAEAARDDVEEIHLRTSAATALALLNTKRREISDIEQANNVAIIVKADPALVGVDYAVDRKRARRFKQEGETTGEAQPQRQEGRQEPRNDRNERGERADRGDRGDRPRRDRNDRPRQDASAYAADTAASAAPQQDGLTEAEGFQPQSAELNQDGQPYGHRNRNRGDRDRGRNRNRNRNRDRNRGDRNGAGFQPGSELSGAPLMDDTQPAFDGSEAQPGTTAPRPPREHRDHGQNRRRQPRGGMGGAEGLPHDETGFSANDSAPGRDFDQDGDVKSEERSRLRGLWKKITQ